MKVTVKQLFYLAHKIYDYKRAWLYKEFEVPFVPQKGMMIAIEPYTFPREIEKIEWDTTNNHAIIVWLETMEYGRESSGRKQKRMVKEDVKTKDQIKFEEDIKNRKSWGWMEEEKEGKIITD